MDCWRTSAPPGARLIVALLAFAQRPYDRVLPKSAGLVCRDLPKLHLKALMAHEILKPDLLQMARHSLPPQWCHPTPLPLGLHEARICSLCRWACTILGGWACAILGGGSPSCSRTA
eukprot:1153282-Pelagomonas_calceolata.AAC.1